MRANLEPCELLRCRTVNQLGLTQLGKEGVFGRAWPRQKSRPGRRLTNGRIEYHFNLKYLVCNQLEPLQTEPRRRRSIR